MAGYSEQRDAAGRVTIVVKDTQVWWLAVYALAIFQAARADQRRASPLRDAWIPTTT